MATSTAGWPSMDAGTPPRSRRAPPDCPRTEGVVSAPENARYGPLTTWAIVNYAGIRR